MKMRQIITGVMVILLTTGSPHVWSQSSPSYKPHSWAYVLSTAWSRLQSFAKIRATPQTSKGIGKYGTGKESSPNPSRPYVVPEIDAASGTSAIALLVGVLLLASERSRFKRHS
jgi:hypothetical protein